MAAVAYLLLPVTGLIVYGTTRDRRTRFHALQAIALGLAFPVVLFLASLGPPAIVQVTFVAGAVTWIGFLVTTAAGRDPRLPVIGRRLEILSVVSLRDEPRSTSGS